MNGSSDLSKAPSPIAWLDARPLDRMTEELRQAQAAFRSLVDSLPLNLLIKDAQGRRRFANRSYLQLHQLTLEDVVGKTDFDLFPEVLARRFKQDDDAILHTGNVMHDTEEYATPDGRTRWIDRIKSPLRDADGDIVGVQVLFWDVTDLQQAQLSLDQERYLLQSLMDNIPDSIYFKDRESRFLRISRAMADRFRFGDTSEVIGKSDADIFTREHAQQALADEREIMRTGRPIIASVERETWPDREDTWVSTTKMPLRDNSNRIVGTFGISRDISDLKHVEEELKEARDAADAASRAKSDFLANMSHEIRTPMNAIIGMTELLLDTQLTATQRDYLKMVQESGESLLDLLNDILDFSKIEAGRLELETVPFDVRDCIGDTMKSLALRAHNKGLELAFAVDSDVPPLLAGDVGRLRQVVVNLVGNAVKFTEVGEVVVDVRCQSRGDDQAELRVSVRDTGVGIPKATQQRIFEEFQQADTSTTRTHGGTGLGLAICARLVDMMQGKIWVSSEPGRGSEFAFTATFGVPEVAPARDRRRSVLVNEAPVLVVDDNATNRRILFDMLTNWGMKPTVATSAREAFDHLQAAASRREPFQIALLDVNMPKADGFELAAWIRDDRALAETPLIMLTSAGRPGDLDRRQSLNIAANLLKPVKQSELFDAIVTALDVTTTDDEREQEAAADAGPTFEGLRVLLAEDNQVNQKLAVGVLGKLGCEVVVAENGRQAVAAWQSQDFDVVLMDVQMPELDGFQATAEIREREANTGKRALIIAMTAHAMSGDRERCLEAGMDDYLSKPVRFLELRDKLAEVLSQNDSGGGKHRQAAEIDDAVDWSDALVGVGGDAELLSEVIETFFDEAEMLVSQVQASINQRDAQVLKRGAHTLKGILLSVGARRASAHAFKLERMGAMDDLAQAGEALEELTRHLDVVVALLREGPPA
ncbi:MAG: response regulator [Pirellulaceae bacterium]